MKKYVCLMTLPLALAAATAHAAPAGQKLPDVEVNLDALNAAPAPQPVPVTQPAPVMQQPFMATTTTVPVATPVAYIPVPAAQTPSAATAPVSAAAVSADPSDIGFVEVGGNYSTLSDGFGTWDGQYIKGAIQTDSANRWSAEILRQNEFADTGYYVGIGNTHDIDEDWFTSISVGAGHPSDATFLPQYRIDGFLNRKLLDRRQLIATVGAGYYKAMDTYADSSLFLGATYYFQAPFIAQVGYRFNNSSPGSVTANSGFVALTEGRDQDHFITFRYGVGEEAYQFLGGSGAATDFTSQLYSVELRKWLGEDIGFNVRGEHYTSPNYDREGVSLGVFHEF